MNNIMTEYITFAHNADSSGDRFISVKGEEPPWATDIQPHTDPALPTLSADSQENGK